MKNWSQSFELCNSILNTYIELIMKFKLQKLISQSWSSNENHQSCMLIWKFQEVCRCMCRFLHVYSSQRDCHVWQPCLYSGPTEMEKVHGSSGITSANFSHLCIFYFDFTCFFKVLSFFVQFFGIFANFCTILSAVPHILCAQYFRLEVPLPISKVFPFLWSQPCCKRAFM